MSVPCPRCGRDYDVALFQFGRTIHCTCGSRVGLQPRVQTAGGHGRDRFLVDAMLGRLARWLRIIGYDAAFEAEISDEELVRRAIQENRVLLTRDRALADEWRVPHLLIVESESPLAQLRQVVTAFALDWRSRSFTRCSRCNATLEPISPDAVAGRIPRRVQHAHRQFLVCPMCSRIYWEGSHIDRIRQTLEESLGSAESGRLVCDSEGV